MHLVFQRFLQSAVSRRGTVIFSKFKYAHNKDILSRSDLFALVPEHLGLQLEQHLKFNNNLQVILPHHRFIIYANSECELMENGLTFTYPVKKPFV